MGQAIDDKQVGKLQRCLSILLGQLEVLDQCDCAIAAAHLAQAYDELEAEVQRRYIGLAQASQSEHRGPDLAP